MTAETENTEAPALPDAMERGRYAVYPQDNGFVIARATGTCDRCQSCGCGDQQEPLDISPSGVARLLGQARKAGVLKLPFPLGRSHE